MTNERISYTIMESPIGRLLVAGSAAGLTHVHFQEGTHPLAPAPGWTESEAAVKEALAQLRAYFAGTRRGFDLALAPAGTPFQMSVWRALATIPYGETISYGELARRVGRPRASRAVGAANGKNPWPIVLPCHRVIGGDGSLTGFGGGIPIKEALLEHERRVAGDLRPQASLFAATARG